MIETVKKRVRLSDLTLSEIQEKGLMGELEKQKKRSIPVPGRKVGRPPKPIDRRAQFSLTFWYGLIMRDFDKLSQNQRTRIAVDCWKTLINKAEKLPGDPEESRMNADEAMNLLRDLETKQPDALKPVAQPKELVPA